MSKKRFETIEEYITRGGVIKKIPPNSQEPQVEVVRQNSNNGPAIILSLDEADLLYGKPLKPKKVKTMKRAATASPKLDINALPEGIRNKFISRLRDGGSINGFEEE